MKITKFMAFLAMASMVVNFASCSDDDDDNSNESEKEDIKVQLDVDKTEVTINKGETATITATLTVEPADKANEVTLEWTLADETIAAVADNGTTAIIKGLKEGETTLKVTAAEKSKTIFVTVNDGVVPPPPAAEYSYFVLALDDDALASLGSEALDMRVNDSDSFFYIWEGTYNSLETSGLNSLGNVAGWYSLEVVENTTWSGLGFCYMNMSNLANMAVITEEEGKDWYLHLAVKTTSPVSHLIGIAGEAGEYKVGINGDYVDNGTTYKNIQTLTTDGEWNEIEIPMDKVIQGGVVFSDKPTKNPNLVFVLSGGVAGTNIQLDAIYFYKKK